MNPDIKSLLERMCDALAPVVASSAWDVTVSRANTVKMAAVYGEIVGLLERESKPHDPANDICIAPECGHSRRHHHGNFAETDRGELSCQSAGCWCDWFVERPRGLRSDDASDDASACSSTCTNESGHVHRCTFYANHAGDEHSSGHGSFSWETKEDDRHRCDTGKENEKTSNNYRIINDALATLARAATPGPWQATGDTSVRAADDEMIATCTSYTHGVADHDYIAAASPDAVLSLLYECDRLRGLLTRTMEMRGDAAAENTNTGLPCRMCGKNAPRIEIERVDERVHVRVSMDASDKDLCGLIAMLRSFAGTGLR